MTGPCDGDERDDERHERQAAEERPLPGRAAGREGRAASPMPSTSAQMPQRTTRTTIVVLRARRWRRCRRRCRWLRAARGAFQDTVSRSWARGTSAVRWVVPPGAPRRWFGVRSEHRRGLGAGSGWESLPGSGTPESRGDSHRARGSTSTKSALRSRVSGRARIAPSGPSTQAQNTRARKVRVVVRPSASAWNLGWMIDWMTKLMTEYRTMTASMRLGPPSSRPMIAGGMTPMTKPMLGMKFVTKASTPQTNGTGDAEQGEDDRVDGRDDEAEDRGDREVGAGALGERGERVDDARPLAAGARTGCGGTSWSRSR